MSLPRILLFAAGLLLLCFALRGEGPVPKKAVPEGFSVRTISLDGAERDARCLTKVFRIETEYGTLDLNLEKLRNISFSTHEGKLTANVELENKSHLGGLAISKEFLLEDIPEPLKVTDLREIRIVRDIDTSLLMIILGLVSLALMEIVLGIDNIIFLAIVSGRLPPAQQPRARRIGLVAALGTRLGLLFTLKFMLGLTKPLFTLPIPGLSIDAAEISWRDVILLVGGGFLIGNSVRELHHRVVSTKDDDPKKVRKAASFAKTILLIAGIDIVFSLDSVITAVGMVDTLWIMVTAMVIAMLVMMLFAEPVSRFVEKYPTVKVLALSFLILIGVLLVAEGMGQHIEKGYVYFAMAFAVVIEFINMKLRPHALVDALTDG